MGGAFSKNVLIATVIGVGFISQVFYYLKIKKDKDANE